MPLRTLLLAGGLACIALQSLTAQTLSGSEGLPSGRYRLQAEHPDRSRRPAARIVEVTRGATTRERIGR